ncbi:hypothetical protein [Pseudonocardia sp. DLS-67]
MTWEEDGELVTALARSGVARAAPEELPQFEVTARAFLAAPPRVTRLNRRGDPLGLGLESVDVLASTVALTITVEVLKHLAEHYSDKVAHGLWRKVRAAIGKRRSPGADTREMVLPELSAAQLDEVHALVKRRASALDLSEEKAARIADGIVSELSRRIGPPPGDDG